MAKGRIDLQDTWLPDISRSRLTLGAFFDTRAIEATRFFESDRAHRGCVSEGSTISTKHRASFGTRQEVADDRSNLVAVGLEREVTGVKEAHIGIWNVPLERQRASR